MKYDAIIVGAGIVGTACAYRLASEGLRIAIVEEKFVASGVTSAGMGHIVVMDDSEAQFALTNLSRTIWTEISDSMPSQIEYENCGTIWVAADEEELAAAKRKEAFYRERGCEARVIGSKELYKLEPNLAAGLKGGLLVKDDSVVYQLCAAGYFADRAVLRGAELICGLKAIGIEDDKLLLENGKTLESKNFINAAGLHAPSLSPEIKIESKKGHLSITDRYPGFIKHQIVELGYLKSAHQSGADASVAFNVQPRITGQVLIGSSRQPGNVSQGVEANIVSRMHERAFNFMPGLRKMSALRTWTGMRPATADNLPFIGRSRSNRNVIVAAGHEGLGITTAAGTAELVADEIFGRVSRIPREPYSPARLSERL